MATSSSNHVDNLAEGNHKCYYGHGKKSCKKCGVKYTDCECYLEHVNLKVDLIIYKCFCCNRNYKKLLRLKRAIC